MTKKLDPMDLKQIISLHIDKYSNRAISNTLGIGPRPMRACSSFPTRA